MSAPGEPGTPAAPEARGLRGEARPEPAPLSRFIGRQAEAMTAAGRAAEAIGAPRIARPGPPLVPERPPINRLGEDPAGEMSRLKPDVTRPVERPYAVEEQLEIQTPQFFLRNTMRLERYADPDWIETDTREVRDLGYWDDITDAARCAVERPSLTPDTASVLHAMLLAERRVVMIETRWHEVFGRPDPIE